MVMSEGVKKPASRAAVFLAATVAVLKRHYQAGRLSHSQELRGGRGEPGPFIGVEAWAMQMSEDTPSETV